MEENNEEKTTITENIADDTEDQDEKIVADMADTLERPVLNSKNSTKVRRPRSDAQVKAFAEARAALEQKRQLDREKKLAEKKPVGRPRNKKVENPPVQPCMSEVPEDTLSIKEIKNSNKKSKKKVTNMIIENDSSSSEEELIYVKNKKKKKKSKEKPQVIYISASSDESEESDDEEYQQGQSHRHTAVQQQPSYSDPFDSIQFV
jgi:hypothetical protein